MSTDTILSSRRAVPVNIGSMQLYCEEFSISASRVVSESSTVSGNAAVTGTFPHSARITFKGRAFDEEEPLSYALALNSLLRSPSVLTVNYRGLVFGNCRVLSYTAGDSGKNYLDLTVVLSSDNIYPEED